ncbi:hypothetical protein QC762_0050920 [Podospora pseudocomata]|uniref:Uncharacterized protein n=1 Tax=Podospora pseudocomata TaxID=2093779 RepID=A0ABR0GIF3_9PEZI|nr:hypothetical protein QC762_0050920 [Podospora pseudocomata]
MKTGQERHSKAEVTCSSARQLSACILFRAEPRSRVFTTPRPLPSATFFALSSNSSQHPKRLPVEDPEVRFYDGFSLSDTCHIRLADSTKGPSHYMSSSLIYFRLH